MATHAVHIHAVEHFCDQMHNNHRDHRTDDKTDHRFGNERPEKEATNHAAEENIQRLDHVANHRIEQRVASFFHSAAIIEHIRADKEHHRQHNIEDRYNRIPDQLLRRKIRRVFRRHQPRIERVDVVVCRGDHRHKSCEDVKAREMLQEADIAHSARKSRADPHEHRGHKRHTEMQHRRHQHLTDRVRRELTSEKRHRQRQQKYQHDVAEMHPCRTHEICRQRTAHMRRRHQHHTNVHHRHHDEQEHLHQHQRQNARAQKPLSRHRQTVVKVRLLRHILVARRVKTAHRAQRQRQEIEHMEVAHIKVRQQRQTAVFRIARHLQQKPHRPRRQIEHTQKQDRAAHLVQLIAHILAQIIVRFLRCHSPAPPFP